MTIGKAWCLLGAVRELAIHTGEHIFEYDFYSKKDSRFLLGSANGKELLIVRANLRRSSTPTKAQVNQHKRQVQAAIRTYEKFMDFSPRSVAWLDLPNVKLKRFGRPTSIVYESDKWQRGPRWGKKQTDEYIHNFLEDPNGDTLALTDTPFVYINKSSDGMDPAIILIKGKELEITARGIES